MKKITILSSLILLIGCSTTQSNIRVDSIDTFNLDNYNDFNIKINDSSITAEVNPIVLEKFKGNLKNAIEERGLQFKKDSNLIFEINFATKDIVESDKLGYYPPNATFIHSNYYRYNYTFRDHVYTFTNNILRVNLRDIEQDKTVWTVVTKWRDGSSRSISSEDASNILVDEIMISFL
tara:strand:- start:435 stop:968 length:534 start_codon:yes stop_codon:yes gene_type:complete